ncbi:trypsin-like peptidase domain-containing protein [Tautonia sociabilis]|uniref:PDZ domain-containing protein n=1 Tax=Tautonia sociabilis TaxID=2080755 RepID=A0A432MM54_9BACT|nr:trypsin-like peptidase domain-containing protein [Tautonia sociabilis]RUL88523.1 PDZ domain-containing protein [Tautonia sociabilis]
MRRNTVAWAALVMSTAALIGSQTWYRPAPAGPQLPQEGLAEAKRLSAAFEAVAEYVGPSVVQISVQRVPEVRRGDGSPRGLTPREMTPEELEEFMERFRRFFPDGPGGFPEDFFRFEPQQFRVEGTGSGFVYDEQGHILTNNHVVEGATGDGDILVSFSDGSVVEAKVVGTDPATDVAVIKIDPKELDETPRPVRIGSSDDLHVGQWVLAIGSPFGLSQTVTAGIVSATNRAGVGILDQQEGYEDFIQTDAAINPGNSGGPLVDIEGRVIGINSAIATRTRANAGVGFAVPIKLASYVADSIIENGKVQRARLGVSISQLTPDLAEPFGIDPKLDGVLVNEVFPGTPAEKAGLQAGDVIVGFKGQPVESMPAFRLEVSTSPLNQPLELTYIREGKRQTTTITLAPAEEVELPAFARSRGPGRSPEPPGLELDRFGLELQELTPDLAEQLGHPEGAAGVLVRGVAPDSPAAAQGIAAGDLITKVIKDKKPQDVSSLDEFEQLVGDSSDLAVYVQGADGRGRFVVLKAEEEAARDN